MELELGLDPDDAVRLPRLACLASLKAGRARSRAIQIAWHDGPDHALARQGLVIAEQRPGWRLERLRPDGETWPPGAPPHVLAEAPEPVALGVSLPDPLIPQAAFEGRMLSLALASNQGPVALTLLNGGLRAVTAERRASRVRLSGPEPAVLDLALALARDLRAVVPRAALAADAISLARGKALPPRRQGAPELPAGLSVAERWIGDPMLTWIGLCKSTTMAEGDIYRLLARTLEFLSQLHTLKATHPGLADTASRAIAALRRGVLEELP